MADRTYTVAEIDLMREAIGVLQNWPADLEARLQTYIVNGSDPLDLIRPAHERWVGSNWAQDPPPASPFAESVGG